MFNVKIEGLQEVLSKIESYSKELFADVDAELSAGVENIAGKARAAAPIGNSGELSSSISHGKRGNYSYFVSVSASYAPYVEFGTGSKVFKTPIFNFTPEMRDYAREFFVSGKGRLPATPYLFPAYEAEKVKVVQRIRQVLIGDIKRI